MKNDYINDKLASVVDYAFRKEFDLEIDFMDREVVYYKNETIKASIKYPSENSKTYILEMFTIAGYLENFIPVYYCFNNADDIISNIADYKFRNKIYERLLTYLTAAYNCDIRNISKDHSGNKDNSSDSINNVPDLVCVTKCPEMQGKPKCSEKPNGYIHRYFLENGCCPCGNIPQWY